LLEDGWVLVSSTLHVRGAASGVPIDRDAAYLFRVTDGRISVGRTFFSSEDARKYLANA
jgi:hypothetical protein